MKTLEYDKNAKKLVGKQYQTARINTGHTQEDVAEVLNLSPSFVSDLERGKTIGSIHTFIAACNYYKVTPNDILSPLINFELEITNPQLIGFNTLNQANQEIIGDLIKILNKRQVDNNQI